MTTGCYEVHAVRPEGPAAIDVYGFYALRGAADVAPGALSDAARVALMREEPFWLSRICCYLRLSLELRRAAAVSGAGVDVGPSAHCVDSRVAAMEEAQCRIAEQMRRRLRLFGGAPHAVLRRLLWGFFSGALQRPAHIVRAHHAAYESLAAACPDAETADVIDRDLARTLPTHCLFVGAGSVGQAELRRVLRALSLLDAEAGYCQGMAFVAAVLLLHAPEAEAFCVLAHLSLSPMFRLRELYLPGFPLLQRHLAAMRELIARLLPALHQHFRETGLDVALFASQWFLTLYAYQLPVDAVCRLWDIFFAEGWRVMHQAAIAVLQWEQEELLSLDLEETVLRLKEFHEQRNTDEFIRRTLNVPLTQDELESILDAE